MFKRVTIFFIFIYFLGGLSFVFGEEDVCSTSPKYLDCLENLIDKVSTISLQSKATKENGETSSDGGIAEDIKNFSQELKKNIKESAAGCLKFYANSFLSNVNQLVLGLLVLLKSPESVVRDYRQLGELSNIVEKNFLDLCQKGLVNANLTENDVKKIKDIFKQYNSCNPLIRVNKIDVNTNTKWIDIFGFLERLVGLHREILATITRGSAEENVNISKFSKVYYCSSKAGNNSSAGWCKYFDYEIDKILFVQLKKQYSKCSFIKVNIKKKIKELVRVFSGNIFKDVKRIKIAYERLKQSLSNIGGPLNAYEAELASNYWNRNFQSGDAGIFSDNYKRIVFSINEDWSKLWNELKAPFIGVGQFLSGIVNSFGKVIYDAFGKKTELENFQYESISQYNWKEEFIKTMTQNLNNISKGYNFLYNQEIIVDPTPITRIMPYITFAINKAIYLIGWGYNDGSISWYVRKSCQNQCSNVGGRCR